ncbi:MAG: tetratricopeptide repeat protein [Treponema sp.]|jgi:transglutaminase-like putative cysteine protease/tetratricopeptide (TPR) repeat protein|nr:tetratricopeptide repeat protein [Treponema sp.]
MPEASESSKTAALAYRVAFTARSAALFVILCQFCLIARELADIPVFVTALLCAFAAPCVLARFKTPPAPAVFTLVLFPWALRLALALPRFFSSGTQAELDSLVLNLDRNAFVFLLPCYWAALTSYCALRSRRFLRGDIIAGDLLLALLFCVTSSAELEAYRWPVLMIALFAGVVFLQIFALMLSLPPEFSLRRGEGIAGVLVMLALVIAGGLLLIRPSQEGAVDRGGGLLQPKLFQFDFSQILRLESEISMNEDLALIVRKDSLDTHTLIRRFVLSGYNGKQGFYRHETIDEKNHPQRLPNRRTRFSGGETITESAPSASAPSASAPSASAPLESRYLTNQEYFLVNFDSSAFIGMNEPVEVTPFESWDASSFSSAFAVQSSASEALSFELIDSVKGPPTPEALGLSDEEFAYYTEYGGNERLAAYAEEIADGLDVYWDQVQAVYKHLKYGEYRYSLKPGIAPDGDQLSYFLFDVKKGYCSYFAFAMTALLRSLGIPSRIAVGFLIDPNANTFDYYPVQSNMAHAWVEVYYPGYGWIEYDPTTPLLAADEEFTFSSGVPQDLFERLMKEILENRSRLIPKEEDEPPVSNLIDIGYRTGRFVRENIFPLLAAVLCVVFLAVRCGCLPGIFLTRNPRKKAIRLWAHTLRRLCLAGIRCGRPAAEAEWAKTIDARFDLMVYPLYLDAAAARYAPEYRKEEFTLMKERYKHFSERYRKTVTPVRRLLAWLLPPLALILSASGKKLPKTTAVLLFAAFFLFVQDGGAGTQEPALEYEAETPDELYLEAQKAQKAERWERAIELFSRGGEQYPEDSRFPLSLGALYFSRRLYGLAWDEYRKAELLLPDNTMLLLRLSRTAGYLNRDAASAEYLERLLAIEPDNREAIGSLGWMYYKLHRLNEGEELLLAALDRFGDDPDYAMYLGTIYTDMFRYADAKAWYLDAIAGGEDAGDPQFTAIAHYNLALLESRFYNYAESFDRTMTSLSVENRASGRLAQGELFLRRLEFSRVFSGYQAAYEIDTSPLSKISLAQAYQAAGRLEEARLYAEDCLQAKDHYWMLNYGIDPTRYKRDIHEILYHTYRGLAKSEARVIYGGFTEWVSGLVRRQYYRLKSATHNLLFRKFSLMAARAYDTAPAAGNGQRLDAFIQYYNAFESYPRRALDYLRNARDFEVPLIPKAAAAYDLEEGILLRRGDLVEQAIPSLDPLWERDLIAEAYAALAIQERSRGRKTESREAAERLYALNRGALRQEGIPLPVELSVDAAAMPDPSKAEKTLRRVLGKMGFEAVPGSRFRLTITVTSQAAGTNAPARVLCELYDGGKGTMTFHQGIDLESFNRRDIAAFAMVLGNGVFTAN